MNNENIYPKKNVYLSADKENIKYNFKSQKKVVRSPLQDITNIMRYSESSFAENHEESYGSNGKSQVSLDTIFSNSGKRDTKNTARKFIR